MTRKAFVMGSNGPRVHNPLRFAEKDVERLSTQLGSPRCGFEITKPPKGSGKFAVLEKLEEIALSCKAEDTFICYFSGHGRLEKGTLHLLWGEDQTDILKAGLSINHISEIVGSCKAGNKLLILDCCHAGGAGAKDVAPNTPVKEFMVEPKNHLILMAADRLEETREIDEFQGSFLTTKICEGLSQEFAHVDKDHDLRISILEMMDWLEKSVSEYNNRHKPPTPIPVPYLFGQQKGDFYLTQDSLQWRPYEIPWPDGSTIVILPIFPLESYYSEMAIGIGKHPITNAQFKRCLEAVPSRARGQYPEHLPLYDLSEPVGEQIDLAAREWVGGFKPWRDPSFAGADLPVVCVSYLEAQAYCAWVNDLAQQQYEDCAVDLPPHRLWQYAAFGTEYPRRIPEEWLTQTHKMIHKQTSPSSIDITGARTNVRGVSDMIGNVWEWCQETAWSFNNYTNHRGTVGRHWGDEFYGARLRGGGFLDDLQVSKPYLRASQLQHREETRHSDLGFRIAVKLPVQYLPDHIRLQLQLCEVVDTRDETDRFRDVFLGAPSRI